MNKINQAIAILKEILKTEPATFIDNEGSTIISNNHKALVSALRSLELIK